MPLVCGSGRGNGRFANRPYGAGGGFAVGVGGITLTPALSLRERGYRRPSGLGKGSQGCAVGVRVGCFDMPLRRAQDAVSTNGFEGGGVVEAQLAELACGVQTVPELRVGYLALYD